MTRKTCSLLLGLLATLGIGGAPTWAATYTYTGNAVYSLDNTGACGIYNGYNGQTNWDDPKNWGPPCQPTAVPAAGDTAIVPSGQSTGFNHDVALDGLSLTGGLVGGSGHTLSVATTFNWSGGSLTGQDSGIVNLVLGPNCTSTLTGTAGTISSATSINNQGTMIWKGPGAFTFNLTNSGIIDLQADGNFTPNYVQGPYSSITNTGTLKKTGGTGNTVLQAMNLQNSGVIDVESGVIQLTDGPNYADKSSSLLNASTLTGPGVLEWDQSSIYGWSGTININGTLQLGSTSQSQAPGIQGNTQGGSVLTLAGNGKMDWQGGVFTYTTATIGPALTVNVSGPLGKGFNNRGVTDTNGGTINWLGGAPLSLPSGGLTNTGSYNARAAGTAFSGDVFTNNGVVNTFSGDTTTVSAAFSNSGTLNVGGPAQSGILLLDTGGAFGSTGVVNLSIGGTTPGTQFSQIQAAATGFGVSNITLDGALNVNPVNGYVPANGATFQVVTIGNRSSVSGSFAQVNSNISNTILTPAYSPSGVTLTAAVHLWTAVGLAVGPDNLMRVLWNKTDGTVAFWVIDNNGNFVVNNTYGPYAGWSATSLGVGGDGKTRLLWKKTDGTAALWQIGSGNQASGGGALEQNLTFGPYAGWQAKSIATGADNKMRVLWVRNDGLAALWQVGYNGALEVNNSYGPYASWHPTAIAVGTEGKVRVLWDKDDGTSSFWLVGYGDQSAGGGAIEFNTTYGPYSGWTAQGIAVGADNKLQALWTNTSGKAAVWVIGSSGNFDVNNSYGPYAGWNAAAIAAGADNKTRALWTNTDGHASLWQLATGDQSTRGGGLEVNLSFGPY